MRTIISLLSCVLLGVMVKAQGIIALLWFPLGFIIGLFVSAQIVLPIVLGLPRAIRLVSRGAMRPTVYLRLLATPFVWLVLLFVIFFLVGFFSASAAAWLDGNAALNVGTWMGIFAILLSPLSKKSRADFREDFDHSYGRFYTGLGVSDELPPEAPNVVRGAARTTMTMQEAERILDIVSAALQDESHPHGRHPVSALQGYDISDIDTALKLRIANEFLLLSGRPDFDAQFSEGLRLYGGIPWNVSRTFFTDADLEKSGAPKPAMSMVDPATMQLDKRFASIETCTSFGDFCKSLGATESNYWQHIYNRIGIEYTSDSPRGNRPVTPNA